ncbi:ABC transporter ATP-binding protein [Stutzerimonas kirkiae]|uniref:ABC transporter ATP-binding protein n=1 Tax=Stutzerimonas kirkiae TaxID=2211392 RepID=A0A4Q9REE3_9GAMM|nr:ABC transporter ATP-binding protein [Stutzerimonas kirkiae]TBV00059.1 ABC transporter ATP-binding protein [Stutzerimonas kirkiae]TBV05765.1 ABC transporter ATP-binding protein [Stutzerimonas kirkiae]TBV09560.1 ABC transporter ATP-binding protein [Stutzerimonas kirkiae]TBV17358.1 ABC transporter ATP-binding protein [Stutzerimonas kirkiae]
MPERLSWADIRGLALKHRKALLLANLVAILATLCSVPIPLLLPLLVDEVLLGQAGSATALMDRLLPPAWENAVGYVGLMLGLTLLLRSAFLGFSVLQAWLFARLSKDVIYRIRLRLLERLKWIALGEYESLGGGTVATHLVTDLETLDKFIGETLSRLLVGVLTILGTAAILLWMHWQLALLILLFNPLVVYATVQLGKRVKHLKKRENDSTASFTQALTETLDAIQQVRAANRQGYFFSRLGQRARQVRDHAVASQWKTDASNRASGLLFQFGIDIFRAAAMLTVLFSDLSIGQMLAVFSYLWFMIGPVEQLLGLQYAFYSASGALKRIDQLLARADEPRHAAVRDPFAGRRTVGISVRDLHFSYQDEQVLDGLSLDIAPGEKVAIVGASGGGKSTLVQLLLGLYQPQSGEIRMGGVRLEEIGYECVREHVAVVLQHPVLFDDTVRANLCMGRDSSDEACWEALRIAQLEETVARLPAGLDSVVGRSGVRFSGGQRQRLAVARMVLADPHVVILDEATSALDSATEHALHQALARFLQGRTTLIIAHRLSAVKQADRVLVFDGGCIAEQGEHRQLIAEGGLYAKLYGHLQH